MTAEPEPEGSAAEARRKANMGEAAEDRRDAARIRLMEIEANPELIVSGDNLDARLDKQAGLVTTILRVRFEKRGGHYHCRVFTAPRLGVTFAKNGDLVFDEPEWPDIRLLMRGAEFIEEETVCP